MGTMSFKSCRDWLVESQTMNGRMKFHKRGKIRFLSQSWGTPKARDRLKMVEDGWSLQLSLQNLLKIDANWCKFCEVLYFDTFQKRCYTTRDLDWCNWSFLFPVTTCRTCRTSGMGWPDGSRILCRGQGCGNLLRGQGYRGTRAG